MKNEAGILGLKIRIRPSRERQIDAHHKEDRRKPGDGDDAMLS